MYRRSGKDKRADSSSLSRDRLLLLAAAGELVLEAPRAVLEAVLGPDSGAVRAELHLAAVAAIGERYQGSRLRVSRKQIALDATRWTHRDSSAFL